MQALKTIPVEDAIQLIAEHFGHIRMAAETIPLSDALDSVLAEEIIASTYIPNFNRATVDGYAAMTEDLETCSESSPVKLTLIGHSKMGQQTSLQLQHGQCAYVPTGGEVPAGTQAMIKIEETLELGEDLVGFTQPVSTGLNMIFRGEDTKPGDRIIPVGKRLKIADTGTLAAMGIMDVPVMQKPRVGIISTGDEVVPASEEISGGMIRDANAPMLANAIHVNGGQPVFFGIVKDEIESVQQLMQKAIQECDLLIISGGTSMDIRDTVASIISQLGQVIVHGITLKPGKPTIIGTIQGKPVFGLPGNPVSAYFTYHLLVRPLLHSMLGTPLVDHFIQLPLAKAVSPNDGRQEYIPVIIQDGLVHPVAFKSGLITTVSCADGYICMPRGAAGIPKNTLVKVTYLDR